MAMDAGRKTARRDAFELIQEWGGRALVSEYDPSTDSWFFVALHDDTLGTPVGGCRMMVYDRPEDGLLDAMRLAEGMTAKWASVGLGFGGGKAVIALSQPLSASDRGGLIRRFGGLLNTLNGAFGTGEDLGTTPDDMLLLASVSPHVVGVSDLPGAPTDPGPFTALGVFSGIRAALEYRFGSDSLEGRSVLIQGVGDVGRPLAKLVAHARGRVILSDLDHDRAERLASEVGGEVVRGEEVYSHPCDVYSPCAVGSTLNDRSIPLLACQIVAGSANNQLETDGDADRLLKRAILYAPDYVINAGGALAFGLLFRGEAQPSELDSRVSMLRDTLSGIFFAAGEAGCSPVVAAHQRVEDVLFAAKERG